MWWEGASTDSNFNASSNVVVSIHFFQYVPPQFFDLEVSVLIAPRCLDQADLKIPSKSSTAEPTRLNGVRRVTGERFSPLTR